MTLAAAEQKQGSRFKRVKGYDFGQKKCQKSREKGSSLETVHIGNDSLHTSLLVRHQQFMKKSVKGILKNSANS